MILKSFLLGNLLSLCMKIINSVVVVGLYYGFLTTFSIGPSYLFLLRARVMEEGTEKEVSATTGFITGQLMMFISIYYAPLHLALGRPHTITALVLPYLLFHFFWNNHKNFFDYGSTTRNSMRNLSIQCVFLNNLIVQLLNYFILPSSTLARLVNIYMFRCNNKILFVTSSFFGWLIGHILFMKWIGLVVFWIRQNTSIRSNKYLVPELINWMARIFSILLFITCVYNLGRMPSPIFTTKLNSETQERGESEEEEESDVENISETEETQQEKEESTEEDPSFCSEEREEIRVNEKEKTKGTCYKDRPVYEDSYLNGYQYNGELVKEEQKEKILFWFEKPFITFLFDYQRWNRPLRYIKIKKDPFENAIRNEMSQYFFYPSKSDGKPKMSFTYLPSLATFSERIELHIDKLFSEESYYSFYTDTDNEKRRYNLSNELIIRIKALEKGFPLLDIIDKKIRLCNDNNKNTYLLKTCDPFLNGPYRGTLNSHKTLTQEKYLINRIYQLLVNNLNDFNLKKRKNKYIRDSLEFDTQLFFNCIGNSLYSINQFFFEPISIFILRKKGLLTKQTKADLLFKNQENLEFDGVTNDFIGIEEISKKIPKWLYKLSNGYRREFGDESSLNDGIRSRNSKYLIIYTDLDDDYNETINTIKTHEQEEVIILLDYLPQSDFNHDLIRGAMRAQRRKIITLKLLQANVHSPLFFDRIEKTLFFYTSEMKNLLFRNFLIKDEEYKKLYLEEEKTKKIEESLEIAEAWENIPSAQTTRSLLLLAQSFIRKYIVFLSFIIVKNIGLILLLQTPEWAEDWKDWNREMHIKCTSTGLQLSEKEFPINWLTEGMQIKIIFPFRLILWRKAKKEILLKEKIKERNDCFFLTVSGMETEVPFGNPRKQSSFLKKELKKIIRRIRKKIVLFLKEQTKSKWITKKALIIKKIMKEFDKFNLFSLLELVKTKIYEPTNNKKRKELKTDQKVSNEPIIVSQPITELSLIENNNKDVFARTRIMQNKIKKIQKDKEKLIKYNKNKLKSNKKMWKIIIKYIYIRLIRKLNYFIKSFSYKSYINIFSLAIYFDDTNLPIFLKSIKKLSNKICPVNNQEKRYNKNQKTKPIVPTKRREFDKTYISNNNIFFDLSYLSQAYVLYKLLQTPLLNNYHFISLISDQGIYKFLKDQIKEFFITQAILDYDFHHNQMIKYKIIEWKDWFKAHYPYNLLNKTWRKKRKNKKSKDYTIKNRYSISLDLYKKKKNSLTSSIKTNDYATNSLPNQKEKLEKSYNYNILSYQYLNWSCVIKNNFTIYDSKLKRNLIIYLCHICNMQKYKSFYESLNRDSTNDRKEKGLSDTYQNNFDRKLVNYQKIDFLTVTFQNRNSFHGIFNWMGLNQEKIHDNVSTIPSLFFTEVIPPFDAYQMKPWLLPNQSLLFDEKNISANEKIHVQLENDNQKNLLNMSFSKKEIKKKDMEEDDSIKDIQKSNNKKIKQWNKKKETELDFFLQKGFLFQLRWNNRLFTQRMMDNIQIYCLLLKLPNPKEVVVSSINRGEIDFDVMLIQNKFDLTELIEKGIFIIEPICLSQIRDKQFLVYQILTISLTNKNQSHKKKNLKQITKSHINRGTLEKRIILPNTNNRLINEDKRDYHFIFYENMLSYQRRREWRILNCFNFYTLNDIDFLNEKNRRNSKKKLCFHFLNENGDLNINSEKNTFMKCRLFLWPNYRLEDLACMNRYWFDMQKGIHFSMLKIHMYPQL
uniref:hypothetical protein RF1 n=1 Tax=Eriocaulon truncatum TaxID=2006105 RepID=UPI00218217DD|nr:hypothetical protein RF1 [Eriocaulon truncatum]UVH66504.1 hypothetical protein RF1 [Eriocaulon truncatum]UVH66759.1 hypothetical protein RF1 [Eriocaulon truncatum]